MPVTSFKREAPFHCRFFSSVNVSRSVQHLLVVTFERLQFNGMNNKERLRSRGRKRCFWFMHAPGFHVLVLADFTAIAFIVSVVFAWEHVLKHSPSLPSCLPLLIQCGECLSPPSARARFCQDLRSPSRSWLQNRGTPGLGYPTSI